VHGGASGGQQLRIYLQLDGDIVADAELDSYISGGGIVPGAWREVTVPLATAPLAYNGAFDRIDFQSDVGGGQPVLYVDDVVLQDVAPPPANEMQIEHDVSVYTMSSDRFTWQDSANKPRTAVLAHNDGQVGPSGSRGGAMTQFQYRLANGNTRTAGVTTYPNGGYGGFGYVVSHASRSNCNGDDSPLGFLQPGNGFERVFEGRHHAIFRFRQNYPRHCTANDPAANRTIPVTIDWIFSTGRDNPVWAITYDIAAAGAAGTFYDDSRAPYGELNIDGDGSSDIDGTAWGDRYKFTTTSSPISLDSSWTWNAPNTVPYVKEWLNGPLAAGDKRDATMGIVQTQTMTQQDAGGGRDPDVGSDIRPYWNTTSAAGNACGVHVLPCPNDWPYQANANSVEFGPNNSRLTWKTQFGFIGQTTYAVNDGVVATAPGYPKKSYSTYVVLGPHTAAPVEAQLTQVETVQTLTLSALEGSVATSGPAGVDRADTVTYAPPGYDHVYGALTFVAAANQLDANIAVGAGTLSKPLLIVRSFTGAAPEVRFGGVVLTADADYFASLRPAASELWITLNLGLTGATNHLEIAGDQALAAPTGVVAAAVTSTQVDVAWTAVAGALSYEVDRKAPGGAFTQIATPAGNSHSDTTAAASTAYLYRVRAVDAGTTSASSTPDLAITVIFTDSPLTAGTVVKAVHLSQLRTAVNAVRALASLSASSFTDAASSGTTIKAIHLTELRTALDAARSVLDLSTGGYTDAAPAGLEIKTVHIGELRDRVN
jgi:hypothetical protein